MVQKSFDGSGQPTEYENRLRKQVKLYNAVKSGQIRMDDLNDEGVKLVQDYVRTRKITPQWEGSFGYIGSGGSRITKNESSNLNKDLIGSYQPPPNTPMAWVLSTPIGRAIHRASDVAGNLATFGASWALKSNPGEEYKPPSTGNKAADTAMDIIGNISGIIAPGELAYRTFGKAGELAFSKAMQGRNISPTAYRLGQEAVRGASAWGGYETLRQAVDSATNDKDLSDRLKEIAANAALGGIGDPALSQLGRFIQPYLKELAGASKLAERTTTLNKLKNELKQMEANDWLKQRSTERPQKPVTPPSEEIGAEINLTAGLEGGYVPKEGVQQEPNFILRGGPLVPVNQPARTTADVLREIQQASVDPRNRLQRIIGNLMGIRPEPVTIPESLTARGGTAPISPMGDVQAYAGNTIPFREIPIQTERTISRTKVVNNLRKNIGVPIDTGRLTTKGLGEFKVTPEVVRARQAEDIQIISHEVGHYLDKKHNLTRPEFADEYRAILSANPTLNQTAYSAEQLPREGVAEYIRLRLTDPEQARRLAPRFTQFFDQTMPKKVLEGLEKSRQDIDTWISQGAFEQAKGLIDFEGAGKPKFSLDRWYSQYVDDLNALKKAEIEITGKLGKGIESLYKAGRLSRGTAEKARMVIERGFYDANGNKIGEGLVEIVKPLKKMGVSMEDFATYLTVKQAQDLKMMGKKIPFDDRQIKAVLDRLDKPEIQAIQRKIVEFNNNLIRYLADSGRISREAVEAMIEKYPNYVPMMRYFDDDAIAEFKKQRFSKTNSFANITNPIKWMSETGSTRTVINPLESMIRNTFLIIDAAEKNKVGLNLARLADMEGAGAWVERVPGGRSAKEHVLTVYENGEPVYLKVRDPDLYNAMLSLDNENTNSLIRFLGGVAGVLRGGAVLTPEFMLRNPSRDLLSAFINVGLNPLSFFRGLAHVIRKDQIFDQFISSGGAYSTLMALDRDASREALQTVFKQRLKDKALNVVTNPKEFLKFFSGYTPLKSLVGALRKFSEASELATKVAMFERTLKKTGSLTEAAFQARDLMDFNRAGFSIRQANRAIAFLNSGIQGVDKMIRSAKENPASFMTRAFLSLIMPSIALYYINKNLSPEQRKIYENIPQYQKDMFFIIPVGGNQFIRIPKPFEAGVLFATGTDRFMRWLEENDPEAFDGFGRTALDAFTPPMLVSAFVPLLEAWSNYNFFQGRNIVPLGEQRLERKDQYGIGTSLTARGIANILSATPFKDSPFASPRIIDNTIRGYTAGLGQYAVGGLDKILEATGAVTRIPQPEKRLTEQPFFRSFFATTSGGGKIRDDFYKRWDKVSREYYSAKANNEPYINPEYPRLKQAKSMIDKIMKVYKQVQKDEKMSPDEKRRRLDEMDQRMNEIAAMGLGKSLK